jgi:hypothetical protein
LPNSNSVTRSVAAGPRQAGDVAGADRVGHLEKDDGYVARGHQQRPEDRCACRQNGFRGERQQFRRVPRVLLKLAFAPAVIDLQIASNIPAQFAEALQERGVAGLRLNFVRRLGAEHADAPHLRALLPMCRERPRSRRAAEQRDELAPFHCAVPPVLPTERIAHLHIAGDCCVAGFRLGQCLLWVIPGREHAQQKSK